jgi:hypothetical protein
MVKHKTQALVIKYPNGFMISERIGAGFQGAEQLPFTIHSRKRCQTVHGPIVLIAYGWR